MYCNCNCSISTLTKQEKIVEAGEHEHYNFEEPYVTRFKFFEILVSAPFRGVAQLAYRIGDIVCGNFYRRGYKQAFHDHLVAINLNKGVPGVLPFCELTYCVLVELSKSVAKCVFLVFYVIAVELTAMAGLFLPGDARRIMCRLDQLIYVHPVNPYPESSEFEFYCNITAPCMQTRELRKEYALFRLHGVYSPYTIDTLEQTLIKNLQQARAYFPDESLEALFDKLMDVNYLIWQARTRYNVTDFNEERHLSSPGFKLREPEPNCACEGEKRFSIIRRSLLDALELLEKAKLERFNGDDQYQETLIEMNECLDYI